MGSSAPAGRATRQAASITGKISSTTSGPAASRASAWAPTTNLAIIRQAVVVRDRPGPAPMAAAGDPAWRSLIGSSYSPTAGEESIT